MLLAYADVEPQADAAVVSLLPTLRDRLLSLCDINGVVREIKEAAASASSPSTGIRNTNSSSSSAAAEASTSAKPNVHQLWEEVKVRSECAWIVN